MSTWRKVDLFHINLIHEKKPKFVIRDVIWRKVCLFWREKNQVYEYVNLTKSWLISRSFILRDKTVVDENVSRQKDYLCYDYLFCREKTEVYA